MFKYPILHGLYSKYSAVCLETFAECSSFPLEKYLHEPVYIQIFDITSWTVLNSVCGGRIPKIGSNMRGTYSNLNFDSCQTVLINNVRRNIRVSFKCVSLINECFAVEGIKTVHLKNAHCYKARQAVKLNIHVLSTAVNK